METGLTKNQMISQLSKSLHGKLNGYMEIGRAAAQQEPEFFSHLIAWDAIKGQIRDVQVALPVVMLTVASLHEEFVENAFAHIASLGPREFLRSYRFALEVRPKGRMTPFEKLIERYLRHRESSRSGWDRVALQHRNTLRELYALGRVKPGNDYKNIVLFGRNLAKEKSPLPVGSVFDVVRRLKDMSPEEAAGEIVVRKIPFLIAMGALGEKAKNPELVQALIGRMSATELVTNTKALEKMGLKTNPALRGAFDEAMKKAASSTKNVLKASRAADAVGDEGLREKLRGLQDRQLSKMGVEGNWLVLGDKSSSMNRAIEISKHVSATLAKMVKGKVWLVFFDTQPITVDVTGAALDIILKATQHIHASGCTSIGCGLARMTASKEDIDGIAIISDGEENTAPRFVDAYKKYAAFSGKEPTVYLYHCGSKGPHLTRSVQSAGIEMQVIDIDESIDFYSVPNLVATMRTNAYSLVDEVMSTKLLTLDKVFKSEGKEVTAHA